MLITSAWTNGHGFHLALWLHLLEQVEVNTAGRQPAPGRAGGVRDARPGQAQSAQALLPGS